MKSKNLKWMLFRYILASHETIKILQMKTHRLEQLLSLKEKRIEELKRKLLDE